MRGPVIIDRESTVGDRCIVRTVDVEGLLSGTDIKAHLRAVAQEELAKPGVYRIRVFNDRGDTLRRLFTLTA